MAVIETPVGKGIGRAPTRLFRFEYDFARDGGAVGDIPLRGEALPNGLLVTDAVLFVSQALTSGGAATVAVKAQSAADVQAAAAISGAPWSSVGGKRASALTATTAPILLTADRVPALTVAAAALTAGRVSLILTGVLV